MTDSREQIEADMLEFIKRLHVGSWSNVKPFEKYLDRQAAITRAECDAEPKDINSNFVKRVLKKTEMLAKERGEWKAKAERYRAKALEITCDSRGYEDEEAIVGNCCVRCGYLKTKGEYCDWVLKAVDGE